MIPQGKASFRLRFYRFIYLLGLPILFLLLATPAFDTNDDPASTFTACGFWTVQPGDMLIFTSLRISSTLRYLYEQWPLPNWYVFYQYAVLFAANAVITVLLSRTTGADKSRSFVAGWPAVLWCAVFFLPTLLRPQYTVTACWAGIAGWLLLAEGLRLPNFRWKLYLSAGVFLFLFALIRYQAFLGIDLLLGPLIFYRDFEKIKLGTARTVFSKRYAVAALLLLLPILHEQFERRQRPSGASMAYQNAIDAIVNGPNCIDDAHLSGAGFSANDWAMMQKWFWIDGVVFAPEKIEQLSQGIRCPRTFWAGLRHFAGSLYLEWPYIALVLMSAAALQMFSPAQRRRTLWTALYLAVLFLGLSYWSRLPFRIIFPFMAAAFSWLQYNRARVAGKKSPPDSQGLDFRSAFLLAAIFALQFINLWQQNISNQQSRQEFREAAVWFQQNPQTLFVVQGGSFNYEGAFSLQNPALVWSAHNLAPTGFLLHTPVFQDILRHHGMSDLSQALLEKRTIVLINPPVETLRRFYQEHYGREIRLLPVESGVKVNGELMPAYRVGFDGFE